MLPHGVATAMVAAFLASGLLSVGAQYEKYSFRSFPVAELMPLDSTYDYALQQYAAGKWADSVKYLEHSLRLRRLLRDSEAFCGRNCSAISRGDDDEVDGDDDGEDVRLRLIRHILLRAACLKKCKADFPVFQLPRPRLELLEDIDKSTPYKFIQYAYYQLNNLENAVSAAHTYLKKNPEDISVTKNMKYYKTLVDVEPYLIDHEEQPYEGAFVKGAELHNSGDFSGSARQMEQALVSYLDTYATCVAACDGAYEILEFKDFYPTLADLYLEALKCKVDCEQYLTPSVGGFLVDKFVATMYHYLQFSYYKLNDVKSAAPCAASYVLFDPDDQVMRQNVDYYGFYREQWGLAHEHFRPRPEALRYFNQTSKQKEMLHFALNYLQTEDEGEVDAEAAAISHRPDAEFEGVGDYEESLLSEWWQEPKTKWDTGEVLD
ncbi:endoplasmic reticulum protein SC65 [Stigmatopora nigra]